MEKIGNVPEGALVTLKNVFARDTEYTAQVVTISRTVKGPSAVYIAPPFPGSHPYNLDLTEKSLIQEEAIPNPTHKIIQVSFVSPETECVVFHRT